MDLTITELTNDLGEIWDQIRCQFYANATWIIPLTHTNSESLLKKADSMTAQIVEKNNAPVAIACFEQIQKNSLLKISEFAFLPEHADAAKLLLDQIINEAIQLESSEIFYWIPYSMHELTALLNLAGFCKGITEGIFHKKIEPIPKIDLHGFQIRSLVEDITVEEFVKANQLAFAEDESRPLEVNEVQEWITSSMGFNADLQLAVCANHEVIGTILCEVLHEANGENNKGVAWIYGLGTVPSFRRKGIASLLVSDIQRRLVELNIDDIYLMSDAEGGVRPFYESVGFTLIDEYSEYTMKLK